MNKELYLVQYEPKMTAVAYHTTHMWLVWAHNPEQAHDLSSPVANEYMYENYVYDYMDVDQAAESDGDNPKEGWAVCYSCMPVIGSVDESLFLDPVYRASYMPYINPEEGVW